MSAKSSTTSSRLGAMQPWIRDHYATLRDGAAPRLNQTRAVVVPVVVDATHRVRDELLPAAAEMSSRMGTKAMTKSAPARIEAKTRATAMLAAARGQARAEKMAAKAQSNSGHRKLWFMMCASVTGAAAGVALVLWQRSRNQDWVEDDAVHTTLEHEERDSDSMRDASPMNADDPSDADAGATSDEDRAEHHAHH